MTNGYLIKTDRSTTVILNLINICASVQYSKRHYLLMNSSYFWTSFRVAIPARTNDLKPRRKNDSKFCDLTKELAILITYLGITEQYSPRIHIWTRTGRARHERCCANDPSLTPMIINFFRIFLRPNLRHLSSPTLKSRWPVESKAMDQMVKKWDSNVDTQHQSQFQHVFE